MTYTAIGVEPGDELYSENLCRMALPVLRARRRVDGGTFETEANAYYIEDIWNVTPNLLVNIGIRWDNFDNRAANGNSFIKMDNLIAPRMGFSWDMKGMEVPSYTVTSVGTTCQLPITSTLPSPVA